MITDFNKKLCVLNILHENLKHSSPMAVDIEDISKKLQLSRTHLKDILMRMRQSGEIQCDIDGKRSIITQKGLKKYLKTDSMYMVPVVSAVNVEK